MENIIKKLGFNPLTITTEELIKLDKEGEPGPYAKLTYEEFDYLYPIMRAKFLPDVT